MVDFEPPSFSLGLDLDLDSEPQRTVTGKLCLSKPAPQPPTSSSSSAIPTFQLLHEDDDDFESPPTLFNPPLKRPRRGPTSKPALFDQKPGAVNLGRKCNVDGEAEFVEFSSPEEDRRSRDEHPSTQYHSGCSSSKFPLPQHGIFIAQSARKMKQVSNAPASSNMERSSNKRTCPNLTASPLGLGRFHLIDSDSDDPSVSEGTNRGTDKANPLLSSSEQGKRKESGKTTRTEDLWDDFCVEKRLKIPTPALDEFCEEYFKSMQNKYEGQSNTKECYQSRNVSKSYGQQLNLGDPLPPSHRYFFHVDPRIQNLVHSRLPNFFPLGAANSSGYTQPSTPVIDYMGQFSHGDGSKQAAGKNNSATSSGRNRRSSKKSSSEEVTEGSGGWVNPKDCAVTPKNGVKRRANAAGQSAGHWYTASNGKRVYVSEKGQELTGQIAYRNYKKEGGAGSNRSKKKGDAGARPKRTKRKSGAGSKKLKKKRAAKKK